MRFSRLALIVMLATVVVPAIGQDRLELTYAPAPVDNPLKGLVPYEGDVRARFPHSMEFNYLPYSALVKGYDQFDWAPLERMLDRIAGRGHQAVVRIYLEYPGRTGVIPEFLIQDGLTVHKWLYTETQPFPPAPIETPDYEDAHLRASLRQFIAAFGRKYDGDPRLGFLTAGLLGTWGEWHTYPRPQLFASETVQAEVLTAYEAAFRVTPVLLRYPAGPTTPGKTPTARRPFGYHDDSFAWATLDTGRKQDDWYFVPALKAAGPEAVDRWKTHPIGGEIRPEAWGKVFDDPPGVAAIQDFQRCVAVTHATWLMDSGLFESRATADRIRRAEAWVRRMGYEFHIPAVTLGRIADGKLPVRVEVENRGVAPFYYDWRPELGLIQAGQVVRSVPVTGGLLGLLPDAPARVWDESIDLAGLKPGAYRLALRVPNRLPGGHPLKFANAAQDADLPGWLTLGTVSID